MAARIGDRGRAACPLYPSGRVLIDNAPMAARAEAGPIEEGAEIIVVGGDRFCLFVRQFDPSQLMQPLTNSGQPILSGKEEAAAQAAASKKDREQQAEEHRLASRKLAIFAALGGLGIGAGLVAIQAARDRFTPDLVWIPPLMAACWLCLAFLVFLLSAATENVLFFIAAPCAFAALVAGMVWWGPFTAVLSCFVVGVTVTLLALAIEAMRHPIRE